jgi:hypothetical protein
VPVLILTGVDSSALTVALPLVLLVGSVGSLALAAWALWRLAPTTQVAFFATPNFRKRLHFSITANLSVGVALICGGVPLSVLAQRVVGLAMVGFGLYWSVGALVLGAVLCRGARAAERKRQERPRSGAP